MSRSGLYAIAPFYEDEVEEWFTDEVIYRFGVKRASLVVTLDRATAPLGTVPVRLLEAAEAVSNRFHVSRKMGLDAIVQAAAAERVEIYGKPQVTWQEERRAAVQFGGRQHAVKLKLSPENQVHGWSDPYVFRADLEQLLPELAGDNTAAEREAKAEPGRTDRGVSAHPLGNGARLGRAAADFWEEAENEAMRWLQDNGFPAPNDGNQAKLERHILNWLEGQKYESSEATVRRHVRRCIARYRDEIEARDQNATK
jgi:hypothetical protein